MLSRTNPYKLLIAGAVLCFVSLFFVWVPSQEYSTLTTVNRPNSELPSQIVPTTGHTQSINGFSDLGAGPIVEFLILVYFVIGVMGLRRPLDQRWQYIAALVGLALMAFNAVTQFSFTMGHVLYVAGVGMLCVAGIRAWPITQTTS